MGNAIGYYRFSHNEFMWSGLEKIYWREIALCWDREDGRLVKSNPFPAFFHELIHDCQARKYGKINHNFSHKDKALVKYGREEFDGAFP
jgi:hypothetical protein